MCVCTWHTKWLGKAKGHISPGELLIQRRSRENLESENRLYLPAWGSRELSDLGQGGQAGKEYSPTSNSDEYICNMEKYNINKIYHFSKQFAEASSLGSIWGEWELIRSSRMCPSRWLHYQRGYMGLECSPFSEQLKCKYSQYSYVHIPCLQVHLFAKTYL